MTSNTKTVVSNFKMKIEAFVTNSPSHDYFIEAPWLFVFYRDRNLRQQGWKIHLSATRENCSEILDAVIPILIKAQCDFKLCMDLETLCNLNDWHSFRESSGKFITIYPFSDEDAVVIANDCFEATKRFKGPRILSDMQYKRSIVHYRYGAFEKKVVYNALGGEEHVLSDNLGNLVEDRRGLSFRAPPWVTLDPFTGQRLDLPNNNLPPKPNNLRLKGRYVPEVAYLHSNKGSVFRGRDLTNGAKVVIKEGRPGVGLDLVGRDAADLIRREYSILKRLEYSAIFPKPIEIFDAGGHTFLVEEFIPGPTLRRYVFEHPKLRVGQEELLGIFTQVVKLVQQAHGLGVILRDLTPNNIIVQPDGQVRLIDAGITFLTDEDEPAVAAGTHHYASPEQIAARSPRPEDDYYLLGTTLFYLATGRDPVWGRDESPNPRTFADRATLYLDRAVEASYVPAWVIPVILKCTDADPSRRWGPARILDYLEGYLGVVHERDQGDPSQRAAPETEDVAQAVSEGVSFLLRTLQQNGLDAKPWTAPIPVDPHAVYYGTAGVAATILRLLGNTSEDTSWRQDLMTVGSRLTEDLERTPRACPGLYFGQAGIIWFLLDASRALRSAELLDAAARQAMKLPVENMLHDLTHGSAGVGLTLLRCWLETGHNAYLDRAVQVGDRLSSLVEESDDGVFWVVGHGPKNAFSGKRYFGLAHGTAGVALFFLHLAALEVPGALEFASRALEAIIATTKLEDEAASWLSEPNAMRLPSWCHGSAGFGTVFARAHLVTGKVHYKYLAHLALKHALASRWRVGNALCHGLAGTLELANDLKVFYPEDTIAQEVASVVELMMQSRFIANGASVFTDERQGKWSPGFSVGLAGVLAALDRHLRGGERLFMLDGLLLEQASRHRSLDDHL